MTAGRNWSRSTGHGGASGVDEDRLGEDDRPWPARECKPDRQTASGLGDADLRNNPSNHQDTKLHEGFSVKVLLRVPSALRG